MQVVSIVVSLSLSSSSLFVAVMVSLQKVRWFVWDGCLAAISRLAEAVRAPFVRTDGTATTHAVGDGRGRGLAGPAALIQTVLGIAGAVATAGAGAVKLVGRNGAPAASTNGNRKTLDDATLPGTLARVHAVVHGEVAADHVGSRGSSVLGQLVRLVLHVGRVFPVVHSYRAAVAQSGAVSLEEWIRPVTALTEAWRQSQHIPSWIFGEMRSIECSCTRAHRS